jgi:hypothetical protein
VGATDRVAPLFEEVRESGEIETAAGIGRVKSHGTVSTLTTLRSIAMTPRQALENVQALLDPYFAPGRSLADELIAERRREAALEGDQEAVEERVIR